MAARRYGIVNGPSKWDLMLSLFDDGCGNCDHSRRATFYLDDPSRAMKEIDILVSKVGKESKGGDSWIFEGSYVLGTVKGFFSTKTRKGWLELECWREKIRA